MRCSTPLLVLTLAARVGAATPSLLVRAGDPSPLGLPFSRFSEAAVDDRGRVAFVGASTALFTRTGGGIVRVEAAGDLLLGHRIAGVGPPVLGANGCLAFWVAFVGGGAGVFTRCGATVTFVAEVGLPAPGGRTFAGLGSDVAIGAGGRLAFTAVLDDGGTGIFVADGDGTFTEVVRTGGASPAGGTFSSFRLVGVSAAGRVGFRGTTSGGPDGLFYWDGGSLLKLVVIGDASPAGGRFTALGLAAVNDADDWTFRASISNGLDPARGGVFRATTSSFLPAISAVVLEGDATPIGGTFEDFPTSLVPAVNSGGAIAFRATVADGSFPSGVFLALPDGALVKMAAVGEPTAAGQLVRLRELALADDGGVVIRASLVGGTPGLFRARGGRVDPLALLGDATDLGAGFRFTNAAARGSAESAVFVGAQEGVYVAPGPGEMHPVAVLGDRTPLGGRYAGFDPPAAGGGRIVFGAGIQAGRAGEALFAAGRRRPTVLAKIGDKVRRCGEIADLFADPLDDLARAGVGRASAAFQAALAGGGAATGIVLWNGSGLRAVGCEGRSAPGGGSYHGFGTPGVGSGARVAFVAVAREPGGTLFRSDGSRTKAVAVSGRETGTRLRGVFRAFDTPAAAGASVAFRAVLDQSREGVFLARGRCMMALAGTGEPEPGGGKFRTFGAPAFAARTVVFRGSILSGSAPAALYRASPSRTCTQVPAPTEALAVAGSSSPAGAPYLGFSAPAGNRKGAITFAADLTGAGPTDAIIVITD